MKNYFSLISASLLVGSIVAAEAKMITPPDGMLKAYNTNSKIQPKDKELIRLGLKWSSWAKVEESLLRQIEQAVVDQGDFALKTEIPVVIMVRDFTSKKALNQLVNEPSTHGYIVKKTNGEEEISLTVNDEKRTKKDFIALEKALKQAAKDKESLIFKHRAKNIEKVLKYLDMEQTLEQGSSAVSLTLSYEKIIDLIKKESSIISSIGLPKKDEKLSMSSAIDATELTYFVNYSGSGARGAGTKIYYREAGLCSRPEYIDTTLYSTINGGSFNSGNIVSDINHSVLVGGILHTISPEAQILCMDYRNRSYTNPFSTETENATLENHSWASPNEEEYTDIDRLFDNKVYTSRRMIFVAAGNRNASINDYVTTPAKALNVISVGNYIDTVSPYEMNKNNSYTSSYVNSDIGNEKPEISAPGTNINYSTPSFWLLGNENESETVIDSGTSFASPHAAAFAANYISGTENSSEFLRTNKSPALLKSLMIASATNPISDGVARAGEGGVNFDIAYNNWQFMENWYDPDGTEPIPNDYPYSICTSVYSSLSLTQNMGETARFALSWLNDGDFIMQHGYTGFDLRLLVQRNSDGHFFYNNLSAGNNAYDSLEISNPNDSYDIYVCRLRNDDPDIHLDMGITVTVY